MDPTPQHSWHLLSFFNTFNVAMSIVWNYCSDNFFFESSSFCKITTNYIKGLSHVTAEMQLHFKIQRWEYRQHQLVAPLTSNTNFLCERTRFDSQDKMWSWGKGQPQGRNTHNSAALTSTKARRAILRPSLMRNVACFFKFFPSTFPNPILFSSIWSNSMQRISVYIYFSPSTNLWSFDDSF